MLMFRWLVVGSLLWPLSINAATGAEYLEAEEDKDPLSAGFQRFKLPFVVERQKLLHLRSYYLSRDNEGAQDQEDWAGGGWFKLISHYWDNRLKLGATAFTSQKIYADDDKADTGLLQPGHEGFSGISEIYVSLAFEQLAFQAGRYEVNMPYINKSDTRMIPQTFQGFHGLYQVSDTWSIGAGMLSHIKDRTSTGFDSLYEKAGLAEDHDVTGLGSIYQPKQDSYAGLYLIHAPDFMNTFYLELSKQYSIKEKESIQLAAQYTHQESEGTQLDGPFEIDHYGVRVSWQRASVNLSAAYTDYSNTDPLRKPWGSIPGYTSAMVKDFDRPGEQAWLVGGSLQLQDWGLQDVELHLKYIRGDTPNCGVNASPNQEEIDLTLAYQPTHQPLAGLSLRLRNAWVNQDNTCLANDARDLTDLRFILNYQIEL